ncbi:reverse transcriptase-like protein [bacterium]|nr:reverse transcriptase-like protein [bacterium]MCG2677472.1 reverse transcriptase-like protein [bacterium]
MSRIVKDSKVLGGKPHIRGTKIPCELILELLASGNSFKEICEEFPKITEEDIQATLSYALDLMKRETIPLPVPKKGLVIYIDGASRGNPGPAGVGVIIYDEKKKLVDELCEYIGKTTNNVAEYQALLIALERARSLGTETLTVYSDCELLVRQMAGEYRVKDRTLKDFYQKARGNLKNFKKVDIRHIARGRNKRADRLANKGINLKG